jgi:hypothetical protein
MSLVVAVLALCVLGRAAQTPPQVSEPTYPYGACRAMASDPAQQIVIPGLGGGLHVLDGSMPQPTLAGTPNDRLRTQGFVRDIALTDDNVFVAAGIGGLQAFGRTDYNHLSTLLLDPDTQTDAFALDVVIVPIQPLPKVFALVGTHEGQGFTGGQLYLVGVRARNETTYPKPRLRRRVVVGQIV